MKIHRRNYLVDKELQGKYILSYFLLIVISSIVFMAILLSFSGDSMTMIYKDYSLQLDSTKAVFYRKILLAIWLFILAGGGASIVFSILFTHRLAGPLYKISQTLDQMLTGEINWRIHLRKQDACKDLAVKINDFNEMLTGRLDEVLRINRSMESELAGLAVKARQGQEAGSLDGDIAKVRELANSLHQELAYFRLKK